MRLFIKAAFRVMLVWLLIDIVLSLISQISNLMIQTRLYPFEDYFPWVPLGFAIAASLVGVLLLWVLWMKTDRVVNLLTGKQDTGTVVISTTNFDFMQAAVRIIGLILILWGLPDLFGAISYLVGLNPAYFETYRLSTEVASGIRWLVTAAAKIILGTILVLGWRQLVNTINKYWDKARMMKDTTEGTE